MRRFWQQKNHATFAPIRNRFDDFFKKQREPQMLRKIFRKVYPRKYELKT